jgi:pimeloyl-ACP methyl ester carboxylesterase
MSFWSRLFVAFALGFFGVGLTTAAAQEAVVGTWSGTLDTGVAELRIVLHVEEGDDGLTATMDSPDQGATGIPVSDVTVTGDSVALEVAQIGGTYEGTLTSAADTMAGTWTQQGRSFPLTFTPADASDAGPPPRPQHPEPPYPYVEEEVTFENDAAGLTLAGTLTRPEGEGPHPAVVLLSGSGPQNRNSKVAGHDLFHVLADHLTRRGVAVLRYDERGVGASEGAFDGATSADFAADAAAAVRFLYQHPAVEADAVGLVGMSEGGIVAPMVHTDRVPVDFLVLMAGPSVPGHEIWVEQQATIAAAQGAPPSVVDSLRSTQRRLATVLRTTSDSAAIAEQVRPMLETRGATDEQIQTQLAQLTAPWFRSFLRYDPAPTLRRVDVPVLALYGSNDLQVPPAQNAEPMRSALAESPSDDVTVRVLDGLNHLFQPAETGLPTRYAQIDTTMAPEALETIATWVRDRTP